jgi:hypothetical protein
MNKKPNPKSNNPRIGSAFDLLGKSYEIVKKNWQAFAVVNILAILSAFFAAISPDKGNDNWVLKTAGKWEGVSGLELASILGAGFLALLLLIIVAIFLYAMATSLEVKSTAGKKPDISELFEDGKRYFFRIFGLVILMGLIIVAGFLLLIVPGIIAIGRLVMAPYYLVDKDLSIMQALKQSNDKAIGNMGRIYGAIGVTILVAIFANIIGAIPVIGALIGVAITIAFSLVVALRYQQLKSV